MFSKMKTDAKVEIGDVNTSSFWCGTEFYDARAGCEKQDLHLKR